MLRLSSLQPKDIPGRHGFLLCWATRVASQVLAAAAIGTMPRTTATLRIRTTNVADVRAERAGPDEARRGAVMLGVPRERFLKFKQNNSLSQHTGSTLIFRILQQKIFRTPTRNVDTQ